MDNQLLVRMYKVGLGDCIYLRVPSFQKEVHILIDCGNKFGSIDLLGECITALKKDLPDAGQGKKHLDLLVVSHPHEDHHKGFEEEFFADIEIDRIWLSPAFDRLNPKAQGFHALKDAAQRALGSLSAVAVGDMKIEIDELLSLSKKEAIDLLSKGLNKGITPLYVTAETPFSELNIFDNDAIKLKVLGPMADIDKYYLGGDGLLNTLDGTVRQGMTDGYQALFPETESVEIRYPRNISAQDFNRLLSRTQANALAVAELAGHTENNLSVVLLLEWYGRRLLFPGDAEWNDAANGKVRPGKSNGSWNVMWQERKSDLSLPLDFYKIGHHGSANATPWRPPNPDTGEEHPINEIFNKLLPKPADGRTLQAYAVASTQRTSRWPTIPDAALLEEIGKRVVNSRTEYIDGDGPKAVKPCTPQPQRTDLETQITKRPESFIQITFAPLV